MVGKRCQEFWKPSPRIRINGSVNYWVMKACSPIIAEFQHPIGNPLLRRICDVRFNITRVNLILTRWKWHKVKFLGFLGKQNENAVIKTLGSRLQRRTNGRRSRVWSYYAALLTNNPVACFGGAAAQLWADAGRRSLEFNSILVLKEGEWSSPWCVTWAVGRDC